MNDVGAAILYYNIGLTHFAVFLIPPFLKGVSESSRTGDLKRKIPPLSGTPFRKGRIKRNCVGPITLKKVPFLKDNELEWLFDIFLGLFTACDCQMIYWQKR